MSSIPGWHGKLPSLGDFASRRLPASFVEAWDSWLASGLLQLREADPAGWLEAYLAAPSRRFLLMPGVLAGEDGHQAWAGVLMPSVDRVGRYFPFTVAQPLPALPAVQTQMQSLWSWLGRLDDLAADALHDDWGVEQLESELHRLSCPDWLSMPSAEQAMPEGRGDVQTMPLARNGDIVQHLDLEAQALWAGHAQGLAYWYTRSAPQSPKLRVSRGLPASAAQFLSGAD